MHVNTNHSLLSACSGAGTSTIPPRYQRGPPLINESQASRASRIKAMFSQDPGGTFPGVFQSKSGGKALSTTEIVKVNLLKHLWIWMKSVQNGFKTISIKLFL